MYHKRRRSCQKANTKPFPFTLILKNMKKLLFFSLSILFFAITSCEKDNSTSIEGRVLEEGTNKPLPNKMVYIYRTESVFLGSYSEYSVDTIFSDSNGNYKWMTPDKGTDVLSIKAIDPLYFTKITQTINSGKNKGKNLFLQPKAWIRYHVKNIKPFDDNDRIKTGFLDSPLYGQNINDSFMVQGGGNQKNFVYWFVTKNSKKIEYRDSIFVKGLDTLNYNINY